MIVLENDLILSGDDGSLILLTVEYPAIYPPIFAMVLQREAGSATITVTWIRATEPENYQNLRVNYLIINPAPSESS